MGSPVIAIQPIIDLAKIVRWRGLKSGRRRSNALDLSGF
jgi:hypothetical protein